MGKRVGTEWQVPVAARKGQGWRQSRASQVALVALVIALVLWIPATFASACDACGEFTGVQAVARMAVALSPMWLLLLAVLAVRFRSALIVLAIASIVMAVVTLVLGTELRIGLEPLGLASATGFVAYAVPFAVVAHAACWDLTHPTK